MTVPYNSTRAEPLCKFNAPNCDEIPFIHSLPRRRLIRRQRRDLLVAFANNTFIVSHALAILVAMKPVKQSLLRVFVYLSSVFHRPPPQNNDKKPEKSIFIPRKTSSNCRLPCQVNKPQEILSRGQTSQLDEYFMPTNKFIGHLSATGTRTRRLIIRWRLSLSQLLVTSRKTFSNAVRMLVIRIPLEAHETRV